MKLERERWLVITFFILRDVSLSDQRDTRPIYGNSIKQWRRESHDLGVAGINVPKKMRQITTRPFHHMFLNYKGPTKHVGLNSSKPSVYKTRFNDPAWKLQWYVQDYRTEAMPVMDHNVVPVYNMKITGRNVTVAVVDVGLDTNHPDIHNNTGRGGKGAIYVFGGGSGRERGDSCSANAFVNNVNTITVGSANKNGKLAYFTERCAAIMATAYASENVNDDLMVTLGENGLCVRKDLGNSGSIALASGILALVLQANSNLTHRDVMHLIAVGSEVAPLADNDNTWFKNNASFWVSSDFGFGLLNAQNMVLLAQKWRNVGPRVSCVTSFNLKKSGHFSLGSDVMLKENFRECHKKFRFHAIEHVQLNVTVDYCFRGGITIKLTSPKGTVSKMLEPRPMDDSSGGLVDWSVTSVQFWGEDPYGKWTISIGTQGFGKKGLHKLVERLLQEKI